MDRDASYEEFDDSFVDENYDADSGEFVEFVARLAQRNRYKEVRDCIERREESRRLRENLGLDLFELPTDY